MRTPRPSPSAKAKSFGSRLLIAREQKGYKQDDVAAMVGVTRGAIGQYEVGISIPRAQKLQRLAEVLGVTVAWLLTGDEPEQQIRAQTQTEQTALELLRSMSPQQQAAAVAMMQGLAGKIGKS